MWTALYRRWRTGFHVTQHMPSVECKSFKLEKMASHMIPIDLVFLFFFSARTAGVELLLV